MKKIIFPIFLTFSIGVLFYVNYLYPLIGMVSQGSHLNSNIYHYYFVIASYLCIIFAVWIERENLAIWNFDRFALLVPILFAALRVNINTPHEQIYKYLIVFLGLILLITCIANWKNIPQTHLYWTLIGLASCIFVIPVAFLEAQSIEKYANSNILYQKKFFSYLAKNFLFTVSFVAPYEEIIIRGILWGQLRKWKMPDSKIIWVQGVLFWLLHFWQVLTPITFFITLPALTIIQSLLVKHSKQLFPAIISHTLINILTPILISVLY